MGDEKMHDKAKSSSAPGSEKGDSATEKAFDKVARLFKRNGIIYGDSVCNSSIKGFSSRNGSK